MRVGKRGICLWLDTVRWADSWRYTDLRGHHGYSGQGRDAVACLFRWPGDSFFVNHGGHEGVFQVFFKNQKIYESHSKNQRRDTGAFGNTDDNRKIDFNYDQTWVFKRIGLVARDSNHILDLCLHFTQGHIGI